MSNLEGNEGVQHVPLHLSTLGEVQGEIKMPYRFGKASEGKIECVNVALQRVSTVSTIQGCNNIASNTQTSDPLEGALF